MPRLLADGTRRQSQTIERGRAWKRFAASPRGREERNGNLAPPHSLFGRRRRRLLVARNSRVLSFAPDALVDFFAMDRNLFRRVYANTNLHSFDFDHRHAHVVA